MPPFFPISFDGGVVAQYSNNATTIIGSSAFCRDDVVWLMTCTRECTVDCWDLETCPEIELIFLLYLNLLQIDIIILPCNKSEYVQHAQDAMV